MVTPGRRIPTHQVRDEQELPEDQHTHFRAPAARANFLAANMPDGIIFAAEEIGRFMSKPTSLALRVLKRLGRYLKNRPGVVFKLPRQEAESIQVYSDTDWGGCVRTRKSTSGVCLIVGSHTIKG